MHRGALCGGRRAGEQILPVCEDNPGLFFMFTVSIITLFLLTLRVQLTLIAPGLWPQEKGHMLSALFLLLSHGSTWTRASFSEDLPEGQSDI